MSQRSGSDPRAQLPLFDPTQLPVEPARRPHLPSRAEEREPSPAVTPTAQAKPAATGPGETVHAGALQGLPPHRGGVLKWIGNKHRVAASIVATLPKDFSLYLEPFVGSGAVLAELAPRVAIASDVLAPLVAIHTQVQRDATGLVEAYRERVVASEASGSREGKEAHFRAVRARYNATPNADDLLFLARTCYGGVIRFSARGDMNTPCGVHKPIRAETLAARIAAWQPRVAGVRFEVADFEATLDRAGPGALVYCDPPYSDSEGTLYGAQAFSLQRLLAAIERAKARGARVALSIDGTKRSGRKIIDLALPERLFESESLVDVGRSMLRRFQMEGQTLEDERVADRLLLTWPT